MELNAAARAAFDAMREGITIIDTKGCIVFGNKAYQEFLKKDAGGRGVKVTTSGNRIYIDVYVVIKYGVSINAVAESLKESVKYRVEKFTGMIVDTVNVNVIGVKL